MSDRIDVLLVEDNPGDARLVEHYLDNTSVETFLGETALEHVESVASAREILDPARFDVVLLDLGLPESSGLETLRRVTAFDAELPVIVLTGLDDTAVAVEAIQSGAQDYLPKEDLDGDRLARSLRYAIERHKHEQMLARRNEQLDFFNSVLRHDMLNGLNVIMANASLLESELADGDRVERAEKIFDWSRNITDLAQKVRTILDTVTEDGERSCEAVELEPVVATEADRADAVTDRVSVSTDVPGGVEVLADDLLSDVLGNLLTNAVEHTEAETTVVVTVEDTGESVRVRVADDGPGVDPDRRDDLFERGSKQSASTGSGFGLFFVDSMVESYGGDVWVEESERDGAAFVLELPRA